MAGELGGRYRLLEVIGSGGMGRVWRADDTLLQRTVAIKELTNPIASVREARAAARLNHPGLVKVYDVVTTEERSWLVMEYVPSRSLHRVVTEDGPLAPTEAARIGLRMLAALRSAHAAGVLHRDVKPDNVLLQTTPTTGETSPLARTRAAGAPDGTCTGAEKATGNEAAAGTPDSTRPEKATRNEAAVRAADGTGAEMPRSIDAAAGAGHARVVLTDFGLATICGVGPDPRLGSPSYIAPERLLAREAGVPGDLWSLAATLYFAVEGRPPYTRGDGGAALRALISEPPDPPVLAGPLTPLLLAVLTRDPAQRPSADMIEQRLREVLDPAVRPGLSRRLRLILAGSVMAVAIGSGAALAVTTTGSPPGSVQPPALMSYRVDACGRGAVTKPVLSAAQDIPAGLPEGWVWFRDPKGFALALPAGWQRSETGDKVCFTDGGDNRANDGGTDGRSNGGDGSNNENGDDSGDGGGSGSGGSGSGGGNDKGSSGGSHRNSDAEHTSAGESRSAHGGGDENAIGGDRGNGGVRAFTVETATVTDQPLAYWRFREETERAGGDLPGYRRIGIGVLLGTGGAEWEYTWRPGPDEQRHERRTLIPTDGAHSYLLRWSVSDDGWAESTALQRRLLEFFRREGTVR